MNIVLLQSKLSEEQIGELVNEFPHFLFLALSEFSYQNLGHEEWARIEILYGSRLSASDLARAHHLRWIHSPVPNLNALCVNEIERQGNIILTTTREENFEQISEFVMAAALAFSKNLFHFEKANRNPLTLWDNKWRDSMWTLKNKIFIQIGLGQVGTEIAKRAQIMDFKVWGVEERRSFHPYCHKVFSMDDLHSILPAGDIVTLAVPRARSPQTILKQKEIQLMKEDSILILIGPKSLIDEEALIQESQNGKFKGVLLDVNYQIPISPSSKLWDLPNLIITPEVSPRPKQESKEAYNLFRYNLRQFTHGNFNDMRNVLKFKAHI